MYGWVRLHLHDRTDPLVHSFLPLIPDPILANLPEESKYFKVIALGARLDNLPAGVLVAVYDTMHGCTDINHFLVAGPHRNKHVGRMLLAQLEKEVKPSTLLRLIYPAGQPESPPIEKILAEGRWDGSRPYVLRCFFHPPTFDAPWLHYPFHYPKGFEEFSWNEVTEDEKEDLRRRKIQGQFPPALSPFKEEQIIEPLNSLGLRKDGRITGWMITHRIDPDTIRYSALYIEHEYRRAGIAIHLLASSIKRHIAAPTPLAVIEVPLHQTHSSWGSFVKKRLVPYASNVVELRQAWKKSGR